MEKAYDPSLIESDIYKCWEENGKFSPDAKSLPNETADKHLKDPEKQEAGREKESVTEEQSKTKKGAPISVVIPPPNVTGVLHMGHALNLTLQDMMVRKYRMSGHDVCWIPGCDHAGIATQNVVEKDLKKQGILRQDLGREAFVNKVWEWKEEYGGRITGQIRKLGASVDWSRERFTMDEGCHEAVLETFVTLYNRNLIYRGEYIINWCPRCQTALSDIEVEHEEADGSFWYIAYPLSGSDVSRETSLLIATTRPETMFGDTAIAVHPSDKRYKDLIGKTVRIPLTDKDIPIVADAHVDPEFGTGAVKVTPAHDANDYAIGERHGLPRVKIMTETGVMNENVPPQYVGLDRFECRKKLVTDLESAGFLKKTEPHQLSKGTCYRCKTVIEPYLSKQWFVAMKKIAQASIDVVKEKKIVFTPNRWEKLYFDWMEDIRDWCISRQIWWGHRIPVWYCEDCPETIVQKTAPGECPACKSKRLRQDEDVLDTWFSSALWPFETFGWPHQTEDLKKYYPTTFLITGYDIITFWVSRMIVMGMELMNNIPFKDVYIHGLIRDIHGKKMSKSIGNAVDPLQLIDEYGADALRWSLASSATLGGQDIRYSEDKVRSCRNFMNKIWNATRYILMVLESHRPDEWHTEASIQTALKTDSASSSSSTSAGSAPGSGTPLNAPANSATSAGSTMQTGIAEQWILSEYATMLTAIESAFETKNFALYCDILWDFIWNKFCDWYVEMSKINKQESVKTLVFILERVLVCIHPVAPFISEALWSHLKEAGIPLRSAELISAPWPEQLASCKQPDVEKQMSLILDVIRDIRHIRKQLNISPGKLVPLVVQTQEASSQDTLKWGASILKALANLESITYIGGDQTRPEQSASSVVSSVQIFVPLKGLIDIDKEVARLTKQKDKIEQELKKVTAKLSNDAFLGKAPEHVVEKIKQSADALKKDQFLLNKQIADLA